jgi:endonuclease/exonuclease/phosphatase family metal-dependent hydrolase
MTSSVSSPTSAREAIAFEAFCRVATSLLAKTFPTTTLLTTLMACDPFHVEFDDVEPAQMYVASERKSAARLRGSLELMNYNVKFGGGRIDFFFDCHGDRVLMTEAEVIENLERIANIVNEVEPDVLLLQEVDINSKRSAYVDQMQWLLDHTHLNYGAYASQWRADFVPSDGLGPVDSGNAILSRWPINAATRYALPLREDQSGLVRYFYLRRNILDATIHPVDNAPVRVIAIHAEAYSSDGTKKKHIEAFEEHVADAAKEGAVIAGGDLNTLPPGSKKLHDFPDSACTEEYLADDFREETDWLDALYNRYNSAIPLADYQADNSPYFTHTTSSDGSWNRTLDYVFSNLPLSNGAVLQHTVGNVDTMDASDHAPLVVNIEVSR